MNTVATVAALSLFPLLCVNRPTLTPGWYDSMVVEVLNPLARECKSIGTTKEELAELQQELTQAHSKVHVSEERVDTALDELAYLEAVVNDRLLRDRSATEPNKAFASYTTPMEALGTVKSKLPEKLLNGSGPVEPYHNCLKNFWYPATFSNDLKDDTMIPIDCFEEPWVVFRGKDGKPGCVQKM